MCTGGGIMDSGRGSKSETCERGRLERDRRPLLARSRVEAMYFYFGFDLMIKSQRHIVALSSNKIK